MARTVRPKKHYTQYEKLLHKLAWQYSKSIEEYEEFLSMFHVIYVLCKQKHNPKKGKFSTYLYNAIKYEMARYKKLQFKTIDCICIDDMTTIKDEKNNFDFIIDLQKSLPNDLWNIVQFVIKNPTDIIMKEKTDMRSGRNTTSFYKKKFTDLFGKDVFFQIKEAIANI